MLNRYIDLLIALKKLSPEQLQEPILVFDPAPASGYVTQGIELQVADEEFVKYSPELNLGELFIMTNLNSR